MYGLKVPLQIYRGVYSNISFIVMEKMLWNYLTDWMASAGLVYDHLGKKFVTKERMAELNKFRSLDTSYEWGIWV